MSIREKPVASRVCDLKDKEDSYYKHLTYVARARATLNTGQPDTPPRLRVAAVNDTRFRRNMLGSYADHDRMIADLQRPRTAAVPPTYLPPRPRHSSTRAQRSLRDELWVQRSGRQGLPQLSNAASDGESARRVTSIKIGYGPEPIIESQDEPPRTGEEDDA
jgi:hypothetical protein